MELLVGTPLVVAVISGGLALGASLLAQLYFEHTTYEALVCWALDRRDRQCEDWLKKRIRLAFSEAQIQVRLRKNSYSRKVVCKVTPYPSFQRFQFSITKEIAEKGVSSWSW